MYFEKCLHYDNRKCIALSQSRRNLLRQPSIDKAVDYLDKLGDIDLVQLSIKKQPVFEWEEKSSCFLYELLNVQNMVADLYTKKAHEQEPREALKSYKKAMQHNAMCLDTLRQYYWKDSDIIRLDIMQDLYHYSKMLINAGKLYESMYRFRNNLYAIRRAYHMIRLGSNLWKTEMDPKYERLTYLEMAKELGDDQMGERLALIQDFKDTPECKEYWDMWYQQNENVYFKAIETNEKIKEFTLGEAFQDLSKLLLPDSDTQKD